ncbi:MAG: hypothetical protein CL483_02155 [Acidobacteria bacterium]|nr:hypothetical protein [Acidobacteriota bacterium]
MTPQLETVLQISAIGTALLFMALAGLIGLMYLLTAQWLFKPAAVSSAAEALESSAASDEPEPDGEDKEEAERDRQRRAVAIAVALACAQAERPAALVTSADTDWRRLHHTRRLNQPRSRARTRR